MKIFCFRILVFLLLTIVLCLSIDSYGKESDQDQKLEEFLKENNIPKAKEFLEEKLKNSANLSTDQLSYYYNKSSQIELMSGNFDKALEWAKKSEKVLSKKPNSKLLGDSYRALCFSFIRVGNLDSALIYAEKLFDFSKKENDLSLRRSALLAMGNISLQNKKYDNSLSFYMEALEASQKLGSSVNIKVDLYNVGLAFSTLKDFKNSNEYLLKAVSMAEEEGDKRLLARAFGTLADNYMDLDNFKDQIYYLNKANKIAKELNDEQLLAMGFANAMQTYIRKNDFKMAIVLGTQALNSLEKKPIVQLQAKVDSMMYISYKAIKNFQEALIYLEKYDRIKEQIRNEKQKQKLEELTLSFEVERKNLKIESQEADLKAEKTKSTLLMVGMLSSILLLSLLIYNYFRNAKTRKIFFQKEKEIDYQIEKQRLQNEILNPKVEKLISQSIPINSSEIEDSKIKLKALFLEILEKIEQKKLYLDPELSQKSLANLMGTNRQYLYEAINEGGEENFRGLINRLRINEAKRILEEGMKLKSKINLTTLNEQVGFRSFSTYYRSFKGLTGLTPNEYAEEFRKTLTRS
jgi:AraC-like DNA-binding protein